MLPVSEPAPYILNAKSASSCVAVGRHARAHTQTHTHTHIHKVQRELGGEATRDRGDNFRERLGIEIKDPQVTHSLDLCLRHACLAMLGCFTLRPLSAFSCFRVHASVPICVRACKCVHARVCGCVLVCALVYACARADALALAPLSVSKISSSLRYHDQIYSLCILQTDCRRPVRRLSIKQSTVVQNLLTFLLLSNRR